MSLTKPKSYKKKTLCNLSIIASFLNFIIKCTAIKSKHILFFIFKNKTCKRWDKKSNKIKLIAMTFPAVDCNLSNPLILYSKRKKKT